MKKTHKLTYTAMLLALTIVLSIFESCLPTLPSMPPGVKLGLSNIAVMYAVFFTDGKTAFFLAFAKGMFALMTRGFLSAVLSLCGGILSVLAILILLAVFKERLSYIIISIMGAVFHNIGQITAVSIILKCSYFVYFPVLIISGIIMGCITGSVLNMIMPIFKTIFKEGKAD